jgi:2-polyprenyl-3-methyl-5-hydroxy-6-metoxy-1,4-benzoquinol methylase
LLLQGTEIKMNSNLEKQIDPTVSCLNNGLHDDSTNHLSSLESIYYDARHYELIYKNNYFSPDLLRSDIPFWIDMANQYGDSILELCCGSGRIFIPLAQTGKLVTGIDILDSMLSEAREK